MTAWEQFWDSVSVLDVVLVIIATSLVIGFIAKGWPKIRAGFRLIDTLGTLPDDLATLRQQVAEIHHEVHFNNGSSVKDSVTRIEAEVKQQGDMLAAALLSDEQNSAALDALEQRFTDHEDTFSKE